MKSGLAGTVWRSRGHHHTKWTHHVHQPRPATTVSAVLCVDIDTVCDTTDIQLACAAQAAIQVFQRSSSEPSWEPSMRLLSAVPGLQANKRTLVKPLAYPYEAVFLVQLLLDELVQGAQQRAAGSRVTRPLQLSEILHNWSEEFLSVCLARWALTAHISPEQLRQQAEAAYAACVQEYAHTCNVMAMSRPAGRAGHGPATATASTPAAGLTTHTATVCMPLQDIQDSIQGYSQALNTLKAAQLQGHHVYILSTWPQTLAARVLHVGGLECAPAWQLQGNSAGSHRDELTAQAAAHIHSSSWRDIARCIVEYRIDSLGTDIDICCSKQDMLHSHMLQLCEHTTVHERLPQSSPSEVLSSKEQAYFITASPARAEQAASLLTQAAVDSSKQPNMEVLLVDWGQGSTAGLGSRVAARASLMHLPLRMIDDAGLASLLALTDSRLVMDGVSW